MRGAVAPLAPAAIDPAISEMLIARNRLKDEIGRLDGKLLEITQGRQQGLAVAVALAAEETAKIASQIQTLASSLHKGIAARLDLEART